MNNNPVVSCMSFKLKIPNISKVKEVSSPQLTLCGLPWQFKIVKTRCGDNDLLSVHLKCMKQRDKVSEWSCAALASFKLLTLDNNRNEVEEPIGPFVFDQVGSSIGRTAMISWKDLLNSKKNFIIDDTVNLELKLDVADPIEKTRSRIMFSRHLNTTYRFIVSNIDNLMATRSPPFIFQKLPFNLVVYKSSCSHLGVYLQKRSTSTDKPLRIRMSAKLIGPKDGPGIEKILTNTLDQNILKIEQLISWEALFDWRSGYVEYNNILMEVELRLC